jgi:cell division protein FtsQ
MIFLFGGTVGYFSYLATLREVTEVNVKFTTTPRFLESTLVNKLLTQKSEAGSALRKDSLDLNMLENQLKTVPEVRNVEAYFLPEGSLFVELTERNPLFKAGYNSPYYVDQEGVLFGTKMLNEDNYPVFISPTHTLSLDATANLIETLLEDAFLARELKEVAFENNSYWLNLKSYPFTIQMGKPTEIKEKIEKLKVFCAFQKLQDTLNGYKKINLSYKNQVVASTF